jgi:serine protease Do
LPEAADGVRPLVIEDTSMRLHRALFPACCTAWLALAPALWAQNQSPEPRLADPEPVPPARKPGAASHPRRSPVVEVVERIKGAVVNIHSERTVRGASGLDTFSLAPSPNRVNGMGTGIVIDPRGYIVTNHHVIEEVSVIRVRLSDRSTYPAVVVARDAENDLALLKIEARQPLPVMPLGTSSDIMVGETVVAIGNAYGYEHTVSVGVVSAIKRDVNLNKEISYRDLIQTDASINPGNSGGPLVNINGELIGVNVAIRAGAQGIGFAIPVDTMIRVVSDLLSVRKRAGVWHGLVCRDRLEPGFQSPVRSVVLERADPSGPAVKAGLRRGDVLLQIGDVRVASTIDVERGVLDRSAGERVPVVVRRGTEEKRFELVLQAAERGAPGPAEVVWQRLGLRLCGVGTETVVRVNSQLHGGLEVVAVSDDGPAAKAGIQRGDILVGLHHWETLTVDNVAFVLNHPDLARFSPLNFFIIRNGQVRRGSFAQVD